MEEKNNFVLSEKAPEKAHHSSSSSHSSSHRSSGSSSSHSSSHRSSGSSSSHSSSHRSSSSSSSHSSSHRSSGSSSSHSSSHSSSSKSKKKTKTHDEKGKLRTVFAFLLFVSLAATVVFSGIRVTMLSPNRVADVFTNHEYLTALHRDVIDYSKDLCRKCGIPTDSIEETITYKSIEGIQKAYTLGMLSMDEKYSETTYVDLINSLGKNLETSTKDMVAENKLSVAESQKQNGPKEFSNDISSYIKKKVEFAYISDIQSVVNVASTAMNIAIAFFAVLTIAFFLLTISVADKHYRAFRSVVYSLFASALLCLFPAVFIGIVSLFKELLIYPSYLCDSVLNFINSCVSAFLVETGMLFFVGVLLSALVWKLKRNSE